MNRRFRTVKQAWVGGAIISAPLFLASPAVAQCQYEVTAIIEAPDCGEFLTSPTVGRGMNNLGHVCGFYVPCGFGNDEAFYWTPGDGFVTLPRPAGVARAWANDISDTGLIVGNHEFTGIGTKGFVYDLTTGEFTHLEPLHDGMTATNLSSANAINSAGLVAGSRSIAKPGQPNVYNAVIWNTNTGEVTDLGVMNGPNSSAVDINAHDDVVGNSGNLATPGEEAFLWRSGKLTMLGPVPAGFSSHAHAVNDHHQVTANGMANPKKLPGIVATAAIWDDLSWLSIGVPDGCIAFTPAGLNNVAQVIGSCTVTTSVTRPALWQHGNYINLLELTDSPPSVSLITARSINDSGSILARGNVNGNVVAVQLAPIEVPLADLDINCRVDVHDLQWLLDQWMKQAQAGSGSSSADLNHDGIVNTLDLLILLSNWG